MAGRSLDYTDQVLLFFGMASILKFYFLIRLNSSRPIFKKRRVNDQYILPTKGCYISGRFEIEHGDYGAILKHVAQSSVKKNL